MKCSVASMFIIFTGITSLSSYADTPESITQAFLQRCAKPVFYAQTANHKKEVQICIASPSVSYSFGKISAGSKEMDILVPVKNTSFASQSNQIYSISEFTIRNGDTSYQVASGSKDEGLPFATLDVYKGPAGTGKHLAQIKLDPNTVVNYISNTLTEEGIPESDSF